MSLESIRARIKEMEPKLRQEFGVARFWIFGSYVRGEENPNSDIDILVEFDHKTMTLLRFIDLESKLSESLGVKVDLVRRAALHPRLERSIKSEAIAV